MLRGRSGDVPPYRMVATDMDGTLLTPDSDISLFTKSTLHQLMVKYPQQVSLALASGRHYVDLAGLLTRLDLSDDAVFLVSCNGAAVHRVKTIAAESPGSAQKQPPQRQLEAVMTSYLSPLHARELLALLPSEEEEINVNLYQWDGWRCTLDWQDELRYNQQTGFRYSLFNASELMQDYDRYELASRSCSVEDQSSSVHAPESVNPLGGILKLFFGSDRVDRLDTLRHTINAAFPSLEITFSSPYCMEITAEGVTKASGLEKLLPVVQQQWASPGSKEAPWTLQSCIAFGDGLNDEEMLRSVGKGCIMANASDVLKSRLPDLEVIRSNTVNGVAEQLKKVFGLL